MSTNIRALAAKCCFAVVDQGRSINDELPKHQAELVGKDKALLQEMCYGVLRHLPELEHHVRQFIDKPLKGKQRVFHFLMLVGVYQLKHMRVPDHAALNETVAATKPLNNPRLKGLVNAVLRNYQRQANSLTEEEKEVSTNSLPEPVKLNHPSWFIKMVKSAYPDNWQDILQANQQRPPMWLRLNQHKVSLADYQELLTKADIEVAAIDDATKAIRLASPTDVSKLPLFDQGAVSVQDGAAQQAGRLIDCQADDIVLDCCAAPGGKTCQMLELEPAIASMTALDIDEKRLMRVQENLERLQLSAELVAGDASKPAQWLSELNHQEFDRILLDAPCSATGVIRRHPDIKWLRKAEDISALAELQGQILQSMWQLLKPGGTLIYATCSVLPQENSEQISKFLIANSDAKLIDMPESKDAIGWQILPNQNGMDGFYYAKLEKAAS